MDNLKRHLTKRKSCVPVSSVDGANLSDNGTNISDNGTKLSNDAGTNLSNNGLCCNKCGKAFLSKKGHDKHVLKCNGLSKKQCPTCHNRNKESLPVRQRPPGREPGTRLMGTQHM